jgi:hypothetical protein
MGMQRMSRPGTGFPGKESPRFFRTAQSSNMPYRFQQVRKLKTKINFKLKLKRDPCQNRATNRYRLPVSSVVNAIPVQSIRIHSPYGLGIPQQVIQTPLPNWNPYTAVQQQYNPMQQTYHPMQQTIAWPQQTNWPMQTIPVNQYPLPTPDQRYWQQVPPQTAWFDPNMTGQIVQIAQQQQPSQQQPQDQQNQAFNDWTPAMATNVTNTVNK